MDIHSNAFKETIERLEQQRRKLTISQQSYWEKLLPEFSIKDNPFPKKASPYPIDKQQLDICVQQIREDGYFVTPPIIPQEKLDQLKQCISAVTTKGHRPSYALMYDIFYEVVGSLENVLQPILGENYQMVPDEFGAFYIQNEKTAKGSPPHRDSIHTHGKLQYRDQLPTLINVWIPLTDATTQNSCIHVIPTSADPYLKDGAPLNMNKSYTKEELFHLLHHTRALPAPAGSVLGWDTNLLHWGGQSSIQAEEPRMSVAFYFQSALVPPYHKFTMDMPADIPFDYRLYLIEKLINDRALKNDSFKQHQQLWHNYHNL